MSAAFMSKSNLAAVLLCTKRSIRNYVNAGLLPQPTQYGRDVGWGIAELKVLLATCQSVSNRMSQEKLDRLQFAIRDLETETFRERTWHEVAESDALAEVLPDPIFLDESFSPEHDLRVNRIRDVNSHRELVVDFVREARQAPKGSDEKAERWSEVRSLRSHIKHLENRLDDEFVHLHGPLQLIGSRELLASPIFNVRNPKSPRSMYVEITFTEPDRGNVKYQGPELRQDDGLVFMALLNIARDVRVGMVVGFSPQKVCEAVWGYYDGSSRARLRSIISRLQEGLLEFSTFRVQLIQRFDFPRTGLWSVGLDSDIVQLVTKKSVVWMDLHQRLSLSSGLTSWLYGYVRSQTTLIPTKVNRLRALCGSEGALDGFRHRLRAAMVVMAGAQIVDSGWSIDKHDMLHWRKIRS